MSKLLPEKQCENLQRCHSTYANDPSIKTLVEEIRKLHAKIPGYCPTVLEVATGINNEEYEYTNGNEVWRLREKDFADRGITFDEDADLDDVPWEDPLDTYKRLTGK